MGDYTREDDVRVRLLGKVRFTDDQDDENKFQNRLLRILIREAEAEVEQDFSPRYMAPFQRTDEAKFDTLPKTTFNYIRTLCELKAVIRVLETDFGRSSATDSDKYTEKLQARYDKMLEKLTAKASEDSFRTWKFPPLPGLRLNYMNTESDDGYAGQILVTGQGDGDYAQCQINDPSETFWYGTIDRMSNDRWDE